MFSNLMVVEIGALPALAMLPYIVGSSLRMLNIVLPRAQQEIEMVRRTLIFASLCFHLSKMSSDLMAFRVQPGLSRLFLHKFPLGLPNTYDTLVRKVTPHTLADFRSPFPLTTEAASSLLATRLSSCQMCLDHADVGILSDTLSSLPESNVPWSYLSFLRLDLYQLTDEVVSFVSKLRVPRLEELQIATCMRDGATQSQVLDLMNALASLPCVDSLKKLSIELSPLNPDMTMQREQQEGYILGRAVIRPLLCFKGLVDFRFASPDLFVNNKMVHAIATSLRGLRILHLDGYMPQDRPPVAGATWKALKYLNERCPYLEDLKLSIIASEDLADYCAGPSNPNLEIWDLGVSALPTREEGPLLLLNIARAILKKNPNLEKMLCNTLSMRLKLDDPEVPNPLWEKYSKSWRQVWINKKAFVVMTNSGMVNMDYIPAHVMERVARLMRGVPY